MSYQTIAYVYISHIQSNISIIFIFVSINRKISESLTIKYWLLQYKKYKIIWYDVSSI